MMNFGRAWMALFAMMCVYVSESWQIDRKGSERNAPFDANGTTTLLV